MSTQLQAEQAIFEVARKVSAGEAREAYLREVCGGDTALKVRVLRLLCAYEESNGVLESPPASLQMSPTVDLPAAERPGATIGPYKLLQVIGEGGMGVVYMAEQIEPVERRVALKIIKPGMDSRHVMARFEAERQALSLMDHPNIAQVLDAGTTEFGRPYFVMELVKGVPITKYCDEHQLAVKERLELMIPVCQAIQHAHQKGIIHRDIKPTNVLVAQYDGHPVPKVIDFGIAKAVDQRLTKQTLFTELGQVVGTLEYMPPEQAELNQLDIDTRSDIYSLGVLLYELLTGSTPFDKQQLRAVGFQEMLRIIREQDPPKPSTRASCADSLPSIAVNRSSEPARLNKTIRGELDWIVMKALEKDRARRYETANSLALDLGRYLSGDSVQACPPSVAYRFRKFARRNKFALTTVALVALALLIGTAFSTWQAIRATRAEALAKANEARALNEKQNALQAAAGERTAREAESVQRQQAEEQARLLAEQRQLLENSQRVVALVSDEVLNLIRNPSEIAIQRHEAILTVLRKLEMLGLQHRPSAYLRIGNLLMSMNHYESAYTAYDAGLSIDPHNPQLYIGRADSHVRQQAYEKAVLDYTSAIANLSSPNSMSPDEQKLPNLRRGLIYCRMGQYQLALDDFEQARKLQPNTTIKALALAFDGNYIVKALPEPSLATGILELVEKFVAESRLTVHGRRDVAILLAQFGHFEQVQAEFQAITAAQNAQIDDFHSAALVAAALGDQAAYREFCMALLTRNATVQNVFTPWSCALMPSALEDYTPAIAIARDIVADLPNSRTHHMALGAILLRAGNTQDALLTLEAANAMELTPKDSNLHTSYMPYMFAIAEFRAGHAERATQRLAEANQHAARVLSEPGNWRQRVTLQLLNQEATQLISSAPTP